MENDLVGNGFASIIIFVVLASWFISTVEYKIQLSDEPGSCDCDSVDINNGAGYTPKA